jgi:type I restriction enzyme M protein
LPNKESKLAKFSLIDEIENLHESKYKSDSLLTKATNVLESNYKTNFYKRYKIQDLFKMKAGSLLNKSEITDDGRYPVYGGNGTVGHFEECNRLGENIVIGRVGAHCGNVHYTEGPIWVTSNSFTVELFDKSKVYLPYLAHVLEELNLNSLARGSAQPSISYEKIKEIEFSLPTYEDQVSLTKWFKEIESNKVKYIKALEEQIDSFNALSNFVIRQNSIE